MSDSNPKQVQSPSQNHNVQPGLQVGGSTNHNASVPIPNPMIYHHPYNSLPPTGYPLNVPIPTQAVLPQPASMEYFRDGAQNMKGAVTASGSIQQSTPMNHMASHLHGVGHPVPAVYLQPMTSYPYVPGYHVPMMVAAPPVPYTMPPPPVAYPPPYPAAAPPYNWAAAHGGGGQVAPTPPPPPQPLEKNGTESVASNEESAAPADAGEEGFVSSRKVAKNSKERKRRNHLNTCFESMAAMTGYSNDVRYRPRVLHAVLEAILDFEEYGPLGWTMKKRKIEDDKRAAEEALKVQNGNKTMTNDVSASNTGESVNHSSEPTEQSSMKVATPTEQSSMKVELPTEQSSMKVELPTEQSSMKVELPTEQSSMKVELPTEQSSMTVELPTEQSSMKVATPTGHSTTNVDTPTEKCTTNVETPTEKSSTNVDTPTEQSTTKIHSTKQQSSLKAASTVPPNLS